MGIDVYLHWKGQTRDESPGYLRESYHGGPYVTPYFVAEAFANEADEDIPVGAPIPARVLRERLPAAVLLAAYRQHIVYGEEGRELDEPLHVDIDEDLVAAVTDNIPKRDDREAKRLAALCTQEQLDEAKKRIEARELPWTSLRFVNFVELAEAKEAETGEPCLVVVDA
jgi:hypothetical protein